MKPPFRVESLILVVGACLVCFVAGAAVLNYRVFPSSLLNFGFEAIASVDRNIIRPYFAEPITTGEYYYPNRFASLGVQRHDPAKAQAGATLFCAAHEPTARLIAMDGKELHSWSMPFSKAWDSAPHIEAPLADRFISFRKAHLYPNGDLLAIYEAPGHWPYAYGLIKLDKDSNLLWSYADLANHDLDVAPDGRVYTLVHDIRRDFKGPEGFRWTTVVDDALVVLSADGQVEKRISIAEALARSDYAGALLQSNDKDIMHANSVRVATAETVASHPFVREGQVLISLRTLSLIVVLDVPSETVSWAMSGSWLHQHSAQFAPDGMVGLFDNEGHIGDGGRSRIIEFDPETGGVTWQFNGSADDPFYSENRGETQYLPNGNVLITESNAGRMLEITRDREVAWEYVVEHELDGMVPAVFWATRYELADLQFLLERP
jgi:hypothetical protein